MRFFPTVGFLVLIIQCRCLPIEILPNIPDGGPSLAAALGARRMKKDAGDGMGMDECSFIESWQEQPGHMNVLAFLDASWEYSHRQATMLKMLQDRLESSGINGIRFFVINSAEPTATISNVDTEDEKEAWGAAEDANDQTFSEIKRTREALKAKIGPDIAFVQDNKELKIWDKLSVSRDQVLVIDKCGRLTYRVIVPWSILHFPYVKAAILSTYKEKPCGRCSLESVETTTLAQVDESQTEEIADLIPENLTVKQMQEIVVEKYKLDQSDYTVKKFNFAPQSQDIPESIIKLLNGSASIKRENGTAGITNITKESLNLDDSYVTSYSRAPIPTDENNDNNNQDSNSSIPMTNESGESVEEKRDDVSNDKNYTSEANESKSDSELWDTSTSSTEVHTDNYIQRTTQSSGESTDYVMPIRIIMHAPHVHVNEKPCKKHEYLVLKFGSPDYHGHLEYDEDFVPIDYKGNNEAESGSGEIGGDEDRKNHHHYKEDGCEENNKGGHLGLIFDKDESPGFYGEDSEYWRNFGNTAYQEELAIEQHREKGSEKPEEGYDAVSITKDTKNGTEYIQTTEDRRITTQSHRNSQTNITAKEKDDIEEEELANYLYQHYSKLIPWLDYVID